MAGRMIDEIIKVEKVSEENISSAKNRAEEMISVAHGKAEKIIDGYRKKADLHAKEIHKKTEDRLSEYKSDERLKAKDESVKILFGAKKMQNEAVKEVIRFLSK